MPELASFAFLNGKSIPVKSARIAAADHGFLYGEGLFETIKVINGKAMFLVEHLTRVQSGAKVLKLNTPSIEYMSEGIKQCIEINKVFTGYLRLTLSRGEGAHSWNPDSCQHPTFLLIAHHGLPYSKRHYLEGFKAITISFPRNQYSPIVKIKSLNYSENILAKMQAREKKADEGLLLNTCGEVAECSMSNIFLIKKGILKTPAEDSGLLSGIIRCKLLKYARKTGLEVMETKIFPDDILTAEEVFITNSLLGVMPLVSLDGNTLGRPEVLGSYTSKLSAMLAKTEKQE